MSDAPTFTATSNGLSMFGSLVAPGTSVPARATGAVTGATGQSSVFTNGGSLFGIDRGILLTTGSGTPGSLSHETLSVSRGTPGHAPLNATLASAGLSQVTMDANVLTVTFWNGSSSIRSVTFDLVFATEERIGDGFPDVAGAWVNGSNVALVDGSAARPLGAVSSNSGLFLDSAKIGLPTSYDAVSTRVTASAPVAQGKNTITFAIGDAGDRDYDSALAIGNFRLQKSAPRGTTVPVDARDDLVLARAGTVKTGSLFADNGFGADYGAGTGHRVSAVDGVAANVGKTIVLASGARLTVRADGTFSYDARPISSSLIADGFHADLVRYTLRDSAGLTTDVATAVFGVYKANAKLPVQLTFDAIGSGPMGFGSLANALAAIAGLSGSIAGTIIDIAEGFNAGGHRIDIDDLSIRAGADSRAQISFLTKVGNLSVTGNGAFGVAANNRANDIRGGDGNDTIYGFGGNDRILGNGGTVNYLFGGDGDDTITGGSGKDIIHGNAGLDILQGGPGDDSLYIDPTDLYNGGDGFDKALLVSPGRYTVGGTGLEFWAGSPGGDEIDGASADSFFFAFGLGGDDTLRGGSGADILVGGDGNDLLHGGGSDDRVSGGAGSDTVDGGAGRDNLIGGPGRDHFRFTPGGGGDQILDWTDGVDILDFSEHDGIESLADLVIAGTGPTAFVFYSDDRSDYIVIYNAFAGGAQLTAADFLF